MMIIHLQSYIIYITNCKVADLCRWTGEEEKAKTLFDLLPQCPVGRQRQRPHGGLQLFLRGGRATAISASHRSDLDVELFWLFVVKVRVAWVKVVLLLLGAACDVVKENQTRSRSETLTKSTSSWSNLTSIKTKDDEDYKDKIYRRCHVAISTLWD